MRKFASTVKIDAPPEKVWALLADQEGWPRWFKGMQKVTVEGTPGVGTGRKMHLGGPVVLDEVITHWEPNRLFGYKVRNNPLVKGHQGLIAITPAYGGGVVVTYTTELELAVPIPGDPLGLVVGSLMRLAINQALGQLKKLAERG
jgi:uncharacterized protein YndB with AHSA1/START domain